MMPLIYILAALIVVLLIALLVNRFVTTPRNIRVAVNVVLGLMVVGMGLWVINTYVPMAGSIKAILNIFVVIATCVGVLQAVGLWPRIVSLWSEVRHRRVMP